MTQLDPYKGINFVKTQAQINDVNGNTIFESNVTFPDYFNENDINIISSKYLCGNGKKKETSITQMFDRVSDTITDWGNKDQYFKTTEEKELFNYKLKSYQIQQYFSFNSPVYFNVGLKEKPMGSACYILGIEDSMDSIVDTGKLESKIFKQGSGSGINYSPLRSSYENVSDSKFSFASGPKSFLQWHDNQAGVIRSGGALRRSAKLACINMDHPDVESFLFCKDREEEKLNILREAGMTARKGFDLSDEVFFQNTNISAQITDSFMEAVESNGDWWTKFVTNGKRHKKYNAKELLMKISEHTWKTGDPAVQFYDTINEMNTCKSSGDIVGSNPCLPAWTPVLTPDGYKHFIDVKNKININSKSIECSDVIKTGIDKDVYEIELKNGMTLPATSNHRITTSSGDKQLKDLKINDMVKVNYKKINFDLDNEEYEKGFLAGYLYADGSIVNCKNGRQYISFALGNAEFDYEMKLINLIKKYIVGSEHIEFKLHYQKPDTCKVLSIHKKKYVNHIIKDIIMCDNKYDIDLFKNSISYQKGFVESMFSFDGFVTNYKYTKLVGITQSGKKGYNVLRQIQLILSSLGIYSNLTIKNNKTNKYGRNNDVSYGLIVNDVWEFSKQFKLWSKDKQKRIEGIICVPKKHPTRITNLKQYQPIISIKKISSEDVYDINVSDGRHFVASGVVVHNCSEYLFLNNSSCNLASINLLKFVKQNQNDDFSFDMKIFIDVIETVFTSQDIIIDNVFYPNEEIEKNSHEFRSIGLGYSNLGATLMCLGYPYDSVEGREIAACFTALLQGYALKTSKKIASYKGPFKHFKFNKSHFYNVISKQIESSKKISENTDIENYLIEGIPFIKSLRSEVKQIWDTVELYINNQDEFRNAQTTLLAPTGTTSSIMGCTTTGIEPEFSLVRHKRLSGSDGATLTYINTVLKSALQNLICSSREVNDAIEQIKLDGHVDNLDTLSDYEKSIFDTSISSGKGIIDHMGHVKMLAAVQPFLMGGISKTINVNNEITPQGIFDLYLKTWKMGIKSVAIYRDGSKNFQPLTIKKSKEKKETFIEPVVTYENRKKMPMDREAKIHKFSINGSTKGYITSGLYEDGELGELFINISRQGSTLSGLMDSLATLTSMALQYHVPLKDIVGKLMHQKFEPKGFTQNPQIRTTSSLVDYIYRYLGLKFLPKEEQIQIGLIQETEVQTIEETHPPIINITTKHTNLTADPCPNCGSLMRTLGTCSFCNNCNFNGGACG